MGVKGKKDFPEARSADLVIGVVVIKYHYRGVCGQQASVDHSDTPRTLVDQERKTCDLGNQVARVLVPELLIPQN